MARALAFLAVLATLAGCVSSDVTTEELPQDVSGRPSGVEDRELYWHQRGSDATRAIWKKFRMSGDVALLKDGEDGAMPSCGFSVEAFNLLLDNVSSFWRRDLAAEAVSAYFGDFSAAYPDRTADVRNCESLEWAIACVRAYRITGNGKYLEEAQKLYDRLWLTQVDNALGGGMWCRADDKGEKCSEANLCAVIAALGLYHATQDMKYLLQGRRLYAWAAGHLFDAATGSVSGGLAADGSLSCAASNRDAGLFVGASMRLYRATGKAVFLANAKKAADRLVAICEDGDGVDAGLPGGIAMRYLAEIARRPGCERYREFILANACSAWTSRRLSDGLNGPDWGRTPLPSDSVGPQDAIPAAVLYFAASRACR